MKPHILILTSALAFVGACCTPGPVQQPPAPEATATPLPAHVVVVEPASHAAGGTPLVRDSKGRFRTHYWNDGKLIVPAGISVEKLALALEGEVSE